MKRVFVSWSGGKDCCLALYRAVRSGLEVRRLANMVTEDGTMSRSHGVAAYVIRAQAEALGIPIMQQAAADDDYEAEFRKMLRAFSGEGITGGVFGDIDFNAHREWIERVCGESRMDFHLPLWLESQRGLMNEFIDAGFESVVVAAKSEFFGEDVLGRTVDRDFLACLDGIAGMTPCGEAGEYHTLVIDGPLFKKRLEITESRKTERDGTLFLEITGTAFADSRHSRSKP